MQNFKFVCLTSIQQTTFGPKRFIHNKDKSIVIAAAARTPWGKYQGQLASVSSWQLGQLAVEAAVKQSKVPLEEIQQIFINENPELPKNNEQFIFSDFLKKAKYFPITVGNEDQPKMENLLRSLEYLKIQPHSAVVVGGFESATEKLSIINKNQELNNNKGNLKEVSSEVIEDYISKSVLRYFKSQMEASFEAEIIPFTIQQQAGKRRFKMEISQDEIFPENCREDNRTFQYSDGAAALVLTGYEKALELNLAPLAVIIDFEYNSYTSNMLSNSRECVGKLLAKTKLQSSLIKHWEIEDSLPQLLVLLKQHLNLNFDVINPHGGSLIMGHSSAASLTRILTHLAHSLNPTEYGCVVCTNSQESLGLIIQKLPSTFSLNRLPLVTLYTKDSCHLCDVLVEELELNFPGEYELEKVFIDTKENIRFLRLYRMDIPVVFFNNQFLCMHRLNHRLLRRKLDLLKTL